jgi:uncharacterized protein
MEDRMNDKTPNSGRVSAAALLAIGLVAAAWIAAAAAVRIADSRSTITVTGSAKRQIRSDMVVWRGTFSAQAPTLQEAYTTLSGAHERVRDYLVSKGLADTNLVFGSISTFTFRDRKSGMETSAITAYRLSQTVEVRSRDVDGITALAHESTELIQKGIEFESGNPEYLYTRLADLKVEMLAQATKDARSRADEMAKNSGSAIGKLRGARMGVFQITPAYSTAISDYGMNDTSSLLKDITAVVSVSFSVR